MKIRIVGLLLQMSSGLRIVAPGDPDYDPSAGYPDHVYLYTGTVNSFHYAATRRCSGRPQQSDAIAIPIQYLSIISSDSQWRSDGGRIPVVSARGAVRQARDANHILETDPYGNFLGQGHELHPAAIGRGSAICILQDGVWNGERILPEGFVNS